MSATEILSKNEYLAGKRSFEGKCETNDVFFMYLAIEMLMALQLVLNYLSQTEASLSRTHFS